MSESPLNEREQRELIARVADSRAFSSSHTLRAFLIFVAEHAIAGRLEEIKEQHIGSQVLGRKPDYDPAEDNIVRVRARQLRQRLEDYFSTDGRQEPVIISIPKGGYVPIFQMRVIPVAKIEEKPKSEEAVSPEEIHKPEQARTQRERKFHVPAAVPWAVAGMAILALVLLLWGGKNPRSLPVADPTASEVPRGLWAQFFPSKGQEVTVVTADSGFALWQDLSHRTLNLGDYLSRRYLEERVGNGELDMREIATRRSTSPADLSVSLRMGEIARVFGGRAKAVFARNLDIHDVKNGNMVFVGSRRSNPWVELFEPQMNFVLDYDPALRGPCFRNKAPRPGEPEKIAIAGTFTVQGSEKQAVQSYAVAALLPSPSGLGKVMILEGLDMEGTEAAGEFVTNLDKFGMLLHRIGLKNDAPVKPFEVLLKLTAVAGGYANPRVIAYRYPRQ